MRNIILVGFMGTGKSVVGKLLAEKLNRAFLELDEVIEKKEKMPIKDIFEKKGELYFRLVEKKAVEEASRRNDIVISAGGGSIVDEENFKALENSGTIICLRASPETIFKRTKDLKTRPLLNVQDPKKQIKELLQKREPYYSKAHFSIDTDNIDIKQIVDKIIKLIAI